VRGNICSLCCGNEREQTVDCPLDCEYLIEARLREKPPEIDPAALPNKDIRINDEFLNENEQLFTYLSGSLAEAGFSYPGIVDMDVREALEALIRTYRTRESGLIYDTRPTNPMAAHVYSQLTQAIDELQRELTQRTGMSTIRDVSILGVLVFLQRLELSTSNGRRKGRAFLDFLRRQLQLKNPQPSVLVP
jgi:hypothetical protein